MKHTVPIFVLSILLYTVGHCLILKGKYHFVKTLVNLYMHFYNNDVQVKPHDCFFFLSFTEYQKGEGRVFEYMQNIMLI